MGFMGIDLKISTSVIFTIAFGIAVDDTIHFMSKYRLASQQHRSAVFALKNTYLSTGRAIILTTIVLIGGFACLLFSGFMGTYYIGLLVSGTLLFALLVGLFVLPFLLFLVREK
jgi:predicted RND superfamily exporter protein